MWDNVLEFKYYLSIKKKCKSYVCFKQILVFGSIISLISSKVIAPLVVKVFKSLQTRSNYNDLCKN